MALRKCEGDHAAIRSSDNGLQWRAAKVVDHATEDLCLVIRADGGEIGLSTARAGGFAAAAEKVEAEHLAVIGVERTAGSDHFAPPALRWAFRNRAASGDATERGDHGAPVAAQLPGNAYVLETAAEMQRHDARKLEDALPDRVLARYGTSHGWGLRHGGALQHAHL